MEVAGRCYGDAARECVRDSGHLVGSLQGLFSFHYNGRLDVPVEDVVNHQVTPHSEADIQPAGEEDCKLWVAPCTSFTLTAPALGLNEECVCIRPLRQGAFTGIPVFALKGFSQRHCVLRSCVIGPEVVQALTGELLDSLRHVDIAILPEDDGEAVEVFGKGGSVYAFVLWRAE